MQARAFERGGIVANEYELSESIEGYAGSVVRGKHLATQRPVIVRFGSSDDPQAIARFLAAAEIGSRIRHPALASLLAYGRQSDGRCYLVSEAVGGVPLDRWADEIGIPSFETTTALIGRLCVALHAAHRNGIGHDSIRSHNILLSPSKDAAQPMSPRLLDLCVPALMRIAPPSLDDAQLMAPEELVRSTSEASRGPTNTDAPMNVYSVGCLLYYLCTGGVPYRTSTLRALIEEHRAQRLVAPCKINPQIPAQLDDLICRMLALAPSDRPNNLAEVAKQLSALPTLSSSSGVRPLFSSSVPPPESFADAVDKAAARTLELDDIPTSQMPRPPSASVAPSQAPTPALRASVPHDRDDITQPIEHASRGSEPQVAASEVDTLRPPPPTAAAPRASQAPEPPPLAASSARRSSVPTRRSSAAPRPSGSPTPSAARAATPGSGARPMPPPLPSASLPPGVGAAASAAPAPRLSPSRPSSPVPNRPSAPLGSFSSGALPLDAILRGSSMPPTAAERPIAAPEHGLARVMRSAATTLRAGRPMTWLVVGIVVGVVIAVGLLIAHQATPPSARMVPTTFTPAIPEPDISPLPAPLPAPATGGVAATPRPDRVEHSAPTSAPRETATPKQPSTPAPVESVSSSAPSTHGNRARLAPATPAVKPLVITKADGRTSGVAERPNPYLEAASTPAPTEATLDKPEPVAVAPEASPQPLAAPARAVEAPAVSAAAPHVALPKKPIEKLQLTAAVHIDALQVKGSLATSVVRRAIERVLSELSACYTQAVKSERRNGFGALQVEVEIDERGRARNPHVSGGVLPGLDRCVAGVSARVASDQSPDTGRVKASWKVVYSP